MDPISWRTPLIQASRSEYADELRRAMVANALSIAGPDLRYPVGLSAGNPDTRRAFESLLGPVVGRWDLEGKLRTEGVSTCALAAIRGLGGRMAWLWPAILAKYGSAFAPFGSIITDAERWSKNHYSEDGTGGGCWVEPVPDSSLLPDPGDVIFIESPEHVLTAIRWEDSNLVSADAGQVDFGRRELQCVKLCSRTWTVRDGSAYLGGRKVRGWISLALVPMGPVITVPEGWKAIVT